MTLSPSNTYFAESAKNGDSTALTASITVGINDVIVVKAQTWDAGVAAGTPSGGSLTYTRQITGSTSGFATYVTIFTAIASSSTTFTLTLSAPAASSYHSMLVEVWPGATLAATPATATAKYSSASLPSMTITTTGTGSAVTTASGDDQNINPSTRAYASSGTGESVGDSSSGANTVQYYWYQQAATAGSQTVGMTAPTGQKWNMASLEIQAASSSTPVSSSDTASGAEATSALTATTSSADTATGVEATSSLTATTSSSDTGTGTEAVSALSATTSSADTAHGTEATSALTATTSSADTASGADTGSVSASTTSSDTASGTDAGTVSAAVSNADTATGTDAGTLSATTSSSDTASGVDAGTISATTSSSDTATGTESAQVGIPSSDTASGAESASVGLSGADTASASESAIVTIFSSDSAVGTDALATLAATVSSTDTGTTTDAQTGSSGQLTASDTAAGVENQSLDTGGGAQVSDTDVAAVTEAESLHVTTTATDTATAVEGISALRATVSSADSANGVESVAATTAALLSADTATGQDNGSVTLLSGDDIVTDFDSARAVETEHVSIKPTGNARVYPYYIRETQPWAIEQERRRHNQALWMVGETTMFALMWHIEDFNNGLVNRCRSCYTSQGAITEVYGQSDQNKCLDCFGTTFDGGFKALIIRPAIFSDTDEGETFHSRGVIHPNDLAIESTPDFRVRNGDYCFRQTGERYYLRVPERITLRTGYGLPTQQDHAIGYNHANAAVEDPTAVAYLIPPAPDETTAILRRASRIPRDWSSYEVIRAPLIPVNSAPPDA